MSTNHRFARRSALLAVVLAVGVAACGSDDSASEAAPDATLTEADTTETDDATETTDATASEGTDDPTSTETGAEAAFPVTIEHAFGETTIDEEPQRVVSVGFAEHDNILALGVTPIAVRDWYGDQPYATWPWAQDELGDAEPEVLASAELNFEQIAALEPDVIIGINSGMSDSDYATLSQIAPTIARPADTPDYGTPWRDQLAVMGAALGRSQEAADVIAETEAKFAAVREAHPEFEGKTAAVSFTFEDEPGAYASGDGRAQTLTEMGFVTPPEFDELAGDAFYFSVSAEELSILDQDVIVWVVSDATGYEAVNAEALRPTLTAYAEGREVIAD
ncbi:MAG: iron-siderophore ABC transporter substrate-binding protein, partial [Ilumatobacteraceae bacterium]